MTNEGLLKTIKTIMADPQSWVAAGLGHNTVAKAEAWVDERARNIAAALSAFVPAEVEGWENQETWSVWIEATNDRRQLERLLAMARHAVDARELAGVVAAHYSQRAAERGLGSPWADLLRVALEARVDWVSIAEQLMERVRDSEAGA